MVSCMALGSIRAHQCIDNLVEGCPDNEKIALWYKSQDQWQPMEIWRELCHPHSTLCPAPITNFCHPVPACPMPALTPAIPAACPLLLGILIDVVTTHSLDPCTLPNKPPFPQNLPQCFVKLPQHSMPTLANSDAFLANSNSPLANSNIFLAAAGTSPGSPEPLGPLPRRA
ncbi:hypothetical protein C0989_007544 [Termitomyces sp. Mn162]|nr:hypothetical protein C0989_007544 [Termitomyces sp. Mn162]